MSTQKLMAATADLHLKQAEEITRLQRNASSSAKKNHGLTRQVHELVSKPQQYPPPRVLEETRPTNQGEDTKTPEIRIEEAVEMEDTTELKTTGDNDYYSLFQPKSIMSSNIPLPNIEYDILPQPEAPTAPPPPPTPPLPPKTVLPTPETSPEPTPERPKCKENEPAQKNTQPNPTRSDQAPPTETPIPAETHLDEREIRFEVMGKKSMKVQVGIMNASIHNRNNEEEVTLRGWMWYGARERGLVGRERSNECYMIKGVEKGETTIIEAEEIRPQDRNEIARYNGRFLVGPGGKKTQIVI
ncbi:hypothetical protein P167DRAFT_580236 [Morchella conica CCBAS932]|uniref:Uncharacterized protein n=1 Tax=Morchella conica CCBAS932 TaxID=1392247 RepID=A0A3N4K7Y1_9PEZI|nr:hypothetical protein P167DRAFT_580236 [Morchella conica CCBAS932]